MKKSIIGNLFQSTQSEQKQEKKSEPKCKYDIWNQRFEYNDGSLIPIDAMYSIMFNSSDLNEEVSIQTYLKRLLLKVWVEEESFRGKNAFGNGGWQEQMYEELVSANSEDLFPDMKTFHYIIETLVKHF